MLNFNFFNIKKTEAKPSPKKYDKYRGLTPKKVYQHRLTIYFKNTTNNIDVAYLTYKNKPYQCNTQFIQAWYAYKNPKPNKKVGSSTFTLRIGGDSLYFLDFNNILYFTIYSSTNIHHELENKKKLMDEEYLNILLEKKNKPLK